VNAPLRRLHHQYHRVSLPSSPFMSSSSSLSSSSSAAMRDNQPTHVSPAMRILTQVMAWSNDKRAQATVVAWCQAHHCQSWLLRIMPLPPSVHAALCAKEEHQDKDTVRITNEPTFEWLVATYIAEGSFEEAASHLWAAAHAPNVAIVTRVQLVARALTCIQKIETQTSTTSLSTITTLNVRQQQQQRHAADIQDVLDVLQMQVSRLYCQHHFRSRRRTDRYLSIPRSIEDISCCMCR
jgi:hypothetical protein